MLNFYLLFFGILFCCNQNRPGRLESSLWRDECCQTPQRRVLLHKKLSSERIRAQYVCVGCVALRVHCQTPTQTRAVVMEHSLARRFSAPFWDTEKSSYWYQSAWRPRRSQHLWILMSTMKVQTLQTFTNTYEEHEKQAWNHSMHQRFQTDVLFLPSNQKTVTAFWTNLGF